MKTTRLGFYSTSEETASEFASVADLFAQSWYEIDCLVGNIEVLSARLSEKPEPYNLIFFSTSATGNDLLKELNALADVCKPESQVYVFSPERDVFVYREILAMGVAGCESLPVDLEFITKEVNGLLNTDGRGKLVLGASLLAGVGFSTALLNVASRCAYRIGPDRSVSLVDGDNTAGITNLFITQSPKSFVQFDTGLSADPFRGSVLCESAKYGNLRIFPTPAKLIGSRQMSDTFLDENLTEITEKSDYTFVDFGLYNSLWGCRAIEYCDHVLLASRPTLNGVRIMREVIQNVIETRGAVEKISCLFIGRGRASKHELSQKKIKEILPNMKLFDVPDFPSYLFSNESSGSLRFQGKRPTNKYEKSIDWICSGVMD